MSRGQSPGHVRFDRTRRRSCRRAPRCQTPDVSRTGVSRGLSPGHGQNGGVVKQILDRLDELYAIGPTRIGYSPEEDAAHELFARWLRDAGLDVETDRAGNTIGRRGD